MKRIAIVGTAPGSMNLTPCHDPSWEIWACSPGTMNLKRIDTFFELHRWEPGDEVSPAADWFPESYVNFLKSFPGIVWMGSKIPEVPHCTVLPWRDMVAKYSPYFFTSSIAWMIAMAIEVNADEIKLFGVDMAATTEYHDQRLGCQYFCMLAKSLGIKVSVPPESDLLRAAPLYGICEHSHAWIKETSRAREIAFRVRQAQERKQQAEIEIMSLQGALDDQDWHLHSLIGSVETMGTETTEPSVPSILVK